MRTTPLILAAAALAALSACGGAGRPSTEDTLKRLNSAGVRCTIQDTPLALAGGARTDSSCVTPDGIEVGITRFGSDESQKAFLERLTDKTSGTVFSTVVYDYGYVMFVPDSALGDRIMQVMDAQSSATGNPPCPTARGGVCGPTTLGS